MCADPTASTFAEATRLLLAVLGFICEGEMANCCFNRDVSLGFQRGFKRDVSFMSATAPRCLPANASESCCDERSIQLKLARHFADRPAA